MVGPSRFPTHCGFVRRRAHLSWGLVPFCAANWRISPRTRRLDGLGVKLVALSVDDEPTTAAFIAKHDVQFPVGYGANADAVAAAVGAFTNDSPRHLQPTAFTLRPNGEILAAVYSTSATGRLVAKDLIGFVSYVKSRLATQAA